MASMKALACAEVMCCAVAAPAVAAPQDAVFGVVERRYLVQRHVPDLRLLGLAHLIMVW